MKLLGSFVVFNSIVVFLQSNLRTLTANFNYFTLSPHPHWNMYPSRLSTRPLYKVWNGYKRECTRSELEILNYNLLDSQTCPLYSTGSMCRSFTDSDLGFRLRIQIQEGGHGVILCTLRGNGIGYETWLVL